MSDNLSEFALKVAQALDTYATKGGDVSLNGVPFHFAMMKMANRLKQQKAKYVVKQAMFPGVALGVLSTLGAGAAAKKLSPYFTALAKPRDLIRRGVTEMAPEGAEAMARALQGTPVEGLIQREAARLHGEGMRPWQLGMAGLGGLAAGQYFGGDRGKAGPPMIIA